MAVTPESNLALIEELQDLVGASTYEPVDGPEFSYPAVGQAVDDEMWQFVTLALGTGILEMGGSPYWLRKFETDSETNSRNQLRLTVSWTTGNAQAVVRGFYHRLVRDMVLDFPMPLTETTYYVVLELNPLKARDPEGPISVKVYPNELNTESGRQHLILWTLTRKPNQLLSDVYLERYSPKVTPMLNVDAERHRPDASTVLWGTRVFCMDSGIEYRASGSEEGTSGPTEWVRIGQKKDWTNLGIRDDYYTWHEVRPEYRIVDGVMEFRGGLRRNSWEPIPGNTASIIGWVPGYDLPNFKGAVAGTQGRIASISTVVSGSSGKRNNLEVRCFNSGLTWFSLDNIRIPLS